MISTGELEGHEHVGDEYVTYNRRRQRRPRPDFHSFPPSSEEEEEAHREVERIMERFDRRDPEIHFRDLAQLRQTGTAEAFISEFQRVAMAVTDITEPRLVMLFTEGLIEPLRGWVKAYLAGCHSAH